MAEQNKRPEATHRQRAAMSQVPELYVGTDGRRYAYLSNSASDLLPTVQFGNLMIGPVTIARFVPVDPTPEEQAALDSELSTVIEMSRKQQQAAEAVCGSERRIIQWALDPSSKVVNPTNGAIMAPHTDPPVQSQAAPATPQVPTPAQPAQTTSSFQ